MSNAHTLPTAADTGDEESDRRIFECELGNHVYDFVSLRDNMRSYSSFLTIADLREISNKAAKAAGRALDHITAKHITQEKRT